MSRELLQRAHDALVSATSFTIRRQRDAVAPLLAELRAELAKPEPQPVGHVRIDGGTVHIVPKVRDADRAGLVDGQKIYTRDGV